MQATSAFTFYYMFQRQHCNHCVAPCNEKSKYHHPLTRLLTLLSFHPRPPNEPLPKTALLQPSGSDTSTGSERISRLPFCPFNPSQNFFCSTPPYASPLYLCLPGRRARSARRPLFRGEKNFFGGRFHGTPQFLKPQILAETLKLKKNLLLKKKIVPFAPFFVCVFSLPLFQVRCFFF